MRLLIIATVFAATSTTAINGVAIAQNSLIERSEIDALLLETEPQQNTDTQTTNNNVSAESGQPEAPGYNPNESADSLNAQQHIKQTFTLRRTINGKVVETQQQTVTYNPRMPYKETEAGQTTVEKLKSTFDREVLTRNEAFEEAKLDFTIADIDRNNSISVAEFSNLVVSWKDAGVHTTKNTNEDSNRQQRYDTFLAEISPETSNQKLKAQAQNKFLFLTGGTGEVSRKDYIREYLLDFDSMDMDNDTILRGEELVHFRAAITGESIETKMNMQPLD